MTGVNDKSAGSRFVLLRRVLTDKQQIKQKAQS
ncbi:paraslipin, partial [Salmonella enterica subsp. enterica serovar Infantis]|nr:paraslipin [Salmonella enterica subsp. enterica serovar Infantis]ECD1974253.1 paraslipin [Salmonella enterica subsp. enterica serovar Infantis]